MKRLGAVAGLMLAAVFGICLLAVPCVSRAQDNAQNSGIDKDWNLRLGVYLFTSSRARKAAGSVGISASAERIVNRSEGWDLLVGVGYNGYNSVYAVPVTVMAIAHPGNGRFGAGLGYSFNKLVHGSGEGLVYMLLAGYQLTHSKNPLSADVRYYAYTGDHGDLAGWSFTFGIGF